MNVANTAMTPTIAKPSAADRNSTCSSTVPPTVKPPRMRGSVTLGSVHSTCPVPCVVATVSSTRSTANVIPTVTSTG